MAMYHPKISYTQRGIPVISRRQMDAIAENYLKDFSPECLQEPCPIDIDQFAAGYLKLNQDFQYLSNKGVYLGMFVFQDTDWVEVYDEVKDEAKYVSEKAGTIIIDRSLLEDNQEGRYRFTMGHECGHGIFHRPMPSDPYEEYLRLFYEDPERQHGSGIQPVMFRCDLSDREFEKTKNTLWTDMQWREWQADAFSSSILMPKSMVLKAVEEIRPFTMPVSKRDELISEVARVFMVSRKAAEIRLQGLGQIESEEDARKTAALMSAVEAERSLHQAGRTGSCGRWTAEEERMFYYRDLELWGYEVPKTRGRHRKKS